MLAGPEQIALLGEGFELGPEGDVLPDNEHDQSKSQKQEQRDVEEDDGGFFQELGCVLHEDAAELQFLPIAGHVNDEHEGDYDENNAEHDIPADRVEYPDGLGEDEYSSEH